MAPIHSRLPEHTGRTTRPRAASLSPTGSASSPDPPKKRRCYRLPVEIIGPVSPPSLMDYELVTPPASIQPFISASLSPMDGLLLYPDFITPHASPKAVGAETPPIQNEFFTPSTPAWYPKRLQAYLADEAVDSLVLSLPSHHEGSSNDYCLQEHTDRVIRSRDTSVSQSASARGLSLSFSPPRERKCCIHTSDESTSPEHEKGSSSDDDRVPIWEVKNLVPDENSGLSFILRRTHLGGEWPKEVTNLANVLCPSFTQTEALAKGKFGISMAKEISKKNPALASCKQKDPGEEVEDYGIGPRPKGGCTVVIPSDGLTTDTRAKGVKIILETINIDSDRSNFKMCSLYASDIYRNHRENEIVRRPLSDFLETVQSDISQSMRAGLIDWLVFVCDAHCLSADTLYLMVYLIDTYLSKAKIYQQQLPLLGITCLLIASKYEESKGAPSVDDLCLNCNSSNTKTEILKMDNCKSSYTKTDILKMENNVLSSIGYKISVPTVETFLRRFLQAAQASSKTTDVLEPLASYLAELTIVEHSFVKILPSMIASSAVFLALWTLDQSRHPWNETLQFYTGYKSPELKATVLALQRLQNAKTSKAKRIFQKYEHDEFLAVACLESPDLDVIFDDN